MYCGGLILAMSLMLVSNSQSVVKAAEPYETFTSTEEWEVLKETNKYRCIKCTCAKAHRIYLRW